MLGGTNARPFGVQRNSLWRAGPVVPPEGKVVLAQHRGIADAETGGSFTVKRFGSERRVGEAGLVEKARVTLAPRSRDPGFELIMVDEADGDEVAVLAELVGVLGWIPKPLGWCPQAPRSGHQLIINVFRCACGEVDGFRFGANLGVSCRRSN